MITEIKKIKRLRTDIPFYADSGLPAMTAYKASVQALLDSGDYTFTRENSSDGLTETYTSTFKDLNTFIQVENLKGIALDAEFLTYVDSNDPGSGFTNIDDPYTLTGIDQPFKYIITYSFHADDVDENNVPLHQAISVDAVINPDTLEDVTVTDTSVVITYSFQNAADFTANFYNDLRRLREWITPNLTRTISYQLV
jgi:hypothetical protein